MKTEQTTQARVSAWGEGWEEAQERRRTGLEVQSMQYESLVVLQLEIEQWRHTQGQHQLFTKSNRQSAPAEQNA